MQRAAILEAFSDLPDQRRRQGKRHSLPLCLALFTLAVAAGNQGFLAIGDWLESYHEQLSEVFGVEKQRLPSYSTIRRTLLSIEYQDFGRKLAVSVGSSSRRRCSSSDSSVSLGTSVSCKPGVVCWSLSVPSASNKDVTGIML